MADVWVGYVGPDLNIKLFRCERELGTLICTVAFIVFGLSALSLEPGVVLADEVTADCRSCLCPAPAMSFAPRFHFVFSPLFPWGLLSHRLCVSSVFGLIFLCVVLGTLNHTGCPAATRWDLLPLCIQVTPGGVLHGLARFPKSLS